MSKSARAMLPDVSRETEAKFERYEALLRKWQEAVNLVSPATLPHIRERHILDSLQIVSLIPENAKILFDLGSGAGFPGLILAMAKPELAVYLIESDQKKCSFLRAVSRETATPVQVVSERIEAWKAPVIPDIITARALASLKALLDLSIGFAQANRGLILVFPKGAQSAEEIGEAKDFYHFDLEEIPSMTDPKARILRLSALCPKTDQA